MNISSKVDRLPPSGIREFFEIVVGMDDVISLGVGEPDFNTPWRIRESGIHSLESGFTSYTSNKGLLELRDLISKDIDKTRSTYYDPEDEILVTTGVSEAYDLAIRALVSSGDEVIVPEPCYVSYAPCIELAGGIPQKIDMEERHGFVPKPEDIEDKITEKTTAIVINNPNNPTGSCIGSELMGEICDIVRKNGIYFIVDEVYSKLTFTDDFSSPLNYENMKERTVLLDGFSKSHAMTGWRVGFAAASKQILGAMNKIHQYTMLCAPTISQKAAIEALKNCEEELQSMIKEYDRRRKFISKSLNRMGLPCNEPNGTFYVFPSIKSTGFTSEEFAKKLLKEEKVAVVPGTAFGGAGEGYIRCSFANNINKLREALKRIRRFINAD